MMGRIIKLFNDCGTFAFTLAGVQLVKQPKSHIRLKSLLTAFLSAFGGGLTRDILLLHHRPAILDSEGAIIIMLFAVFIYSIMHHLQFDNFWKKKNIKTILVIFDAAGTAVFICAGVDVAIASRAEPWVILLSGVVSAIGGGIWAALISGQKLHTILQNAISYRIIVLIHAVVYTVGHLYFHHKTQLMDIVLAIFCISCCFIRIKISEQKMGQFQKECSKKREKSFLRVHFTLLHSQLLRRIANPMQGIISYRVFWICKGRRKGIYVIFSY